MVKINCPCCEHLTIEDEYDICPICFWEHDELMEEYPDITGGANIISLNQAKENYLLFGASENRFIKHVRPPKDNE